MMQLFAQLPSLLAASWLDQLLGLEQLSWSNAEQLQLGWQRPLAPWIWALIVLAAVLLAGWSYHRIEGRRIWRVMLSLLRAALIVLVLALLAGPVLVLPREQVEPDWLLVLVDRSASMQIRDATVESSAGTTTSLTRDQALRDALREHADVFNDQRLGKQRQVLWLGFDESTYLIDQPSPDAQPWSDAAGRTTALRTAIHEAMQRAAGRPVSGIVLFTDGRSPQSTGSDLVMRLKEQAVSVYPVPLGAAQTPLDLAVGRVDAPERALLEDTVPIRVWVEHYPPQTELDLLRVRVKLIDSTTGQTLDEQSPAANAGADEPVRLMAESKIAGPVQWQVRVEYDPEPGVGTSTPELNEQNNVKTLAIEFVDRPVRVLYVEGYPRWDYRYIRSLLLREKSIESSIFLLSADAQFAQEGDLPLARLPNDAEEFKPYDVIIIGDVPAEYFTGEQLTMIRDHVATRGAGLIWIGGESFTPRSYANAPLADLLPMRRPASVEPIGAITGGITLVPTQVAKALNVLELRGPGNRTADRESRWPGDLPALLWAQDMGALQPAAEVLAASGTGSSSDYPLVVRLRYGAGQSLYVATDDTWRWRTGRGELYFEQFWTQIIQMLGRHRLRQNDAAAWMELSHRRIELGQSVVVSLHVEDRVLSRRQLQTITVTLQAKDASSAEPIESFELLPANESSPSTTGTTRYQAIWSPAWSPALAAVRDGRLTLRVIEPALADMNLEQDVELVHPDDEQRQIATDHARLHDLAQQTGGQTVSLASLDQLEKLIPNRARRTATDIREPLWDSPLALMLVVLLLTCEWIGRKLIRLA